MIRHQFHQARLDLNQWMRLAAAIMARTSHGASFVTAPRPRHSRFKHVQLISTQGRLVLMVLVLYGGEVKQQMLKLAEPLPQVRLSQAAESLNKLFENQTFQDIQALIDHLETLEEEVTRLIVDVMQRMDGRSISDIYRDGLVYLLEDEGTRQAVKVREERTLLADVISEAQLATSNGV